MGCCGEIMKSDPCDYFYIKCLFCRDRGVSCSSFLVNTGIFVYTRQQVYQAHTFLSNTDRWMTAKLCFGHVGKSFAVFFRFWRETANKHVVWVCMDVVDIISLWVFSLFSCWWGHPVLMSRKVIVLHYWLKTLTFLKVFECYRRDVVPSYDIKRELMHSNTRFV